MLVGGREILHEVCICGDVLNCFFCDLIGAKTASFPEQDFFFQTFFYYFFFYAKEVVV